MPRLVILLSADALIHASVFCCGSCTLSWYCQKCAYSVAWQSQQVLSQSLSVLAIIATSWRMDETYIIVKGKWVYLYRAVDKFSDTIDFMLSEHRDEAAATAFFKQAIDDNGFPQKVVMDKSGANYAGLENINMLLILAGLISFVEILQVKYLNNLIEQDHRFIKKITNPMMGFKAFHSAGNH